MIVTDLTVKFEFSRGDQCEERTDTFDPDTWGLESDVEMRRDELLEELNDDCEEDEDEWECDGWTVEFYDTDFADPSEFDDLDDYGEYVQLIVEHGEAYKLYYEDMGSCSKTEFEDHYNGCWSSFEEYAEQLIDDCYDIPAHLASYIDYEKWARDLQYDYNTYDGDDGVHIFSQ